MVSQVGLPQSIWETYSAFANTNGGVILLGVGENEDRTLKVFGLANPEKLTLDFWNAINNQQKVNINLLNERKVNIVEIEGKSIITIEAPRAERTDKPVFVGENPLKGTYRRNTEGDYHCTEEEINVMYRDKSIKTQDMLVLETMDKSVFSLDTIRSYRNMMKLTRPEHIWHQLEDEDFLYRLGAMACGENKKLHPTSAGLLMFGYEYEIIKEFPYYFLDYQEQSDVAARWDDRFVSSSSEWSGNIYDFYRKAYNKLSQSIKDPFKVIDGLRIEDTPVHKVIREALANCLINADYYGRQGIVVKYSPYEISFENPGRFRIYIAIEGTVTDPRNTLLMKFFNLIDIGERSGRGVYEIFRVWEAINRSTPIVKELMDNDRTILLLQIKATIKSDDKKATINKREDTEKTSKQKELILSSMKQSKSTTTSSISEILQVGATRSKELLRQLVDSGQITALGDNKNRSYILCDSLEGYVSNLVNDIPRE